MSALATRFTQAKTCRASTSGSQRRRHLGLDQTSRPGNNRADRYAEDRILDLEIKIADLRKWLAEATEKKNGQ